MTMINNNIPMPQVQRQREDIENSSLSPMAAPQGTAFRGKEDDDDKNKTLKTVAFVTLAALGIGYLANSASKGKWNPFDGDWWKSAKDAASNTNSQDTKNATDAIVEATSSAPSSLATDLDQKKTRNISTTVERAMKKMAKEDENLQGKNITEFVGESISMGDRTIEFAESKSGKYGLKVKITDRDKKLTHVYYYNKNGEEIGDARYVLNETSGLTQKIKMDADGNVFKNNGAGKKSGVSVTDINGTGGAKVMDNIEAKTLGQQKVYEAFKTDVANKAAANEDQIQQAIYSAFADNNTATMKQLKAQNGWSDAQATNIRKSFLNKFATNTASGAEQLSAASAQEFLNKYSGKHVTITQKGREGEALVQAFNGATGRLDHVTHFDSNTREITRYGVSASEALQKALEEEDVKNDPTKIFSMDGLRITGVAKKEHGFIDSVEKFSVLKKDATSDKKLFETTKVKGATNTVDQLNGLGENAELFFTHGEHTVDIKDSSKIQLAGGKTLKNGLHTVITDVAPEGDTSWAKLDDKLTKTQAQKKAKTVTVKKTFQSKDSSNKPIELVSMKFEYDNYDNVNKKLFTNITSADNASMRDRMHLQAMMEGANFANNDSGEIGTSIGHLMGNHEELTIAHTDHIGAGNDSFAHAIDKANALNADYVKNMTGFDNLTGANINDTKFSSFATTYKPVSLSLGTLNSEGTRLASRSQQDKTGLTTEYETYNSDGNVELEAKYDNENHKYEVKEYNTDKKLTKHKLTYDHEGKKEYASYEVKNGISEDELKMNTTTAHTLAEVNHEGPRGADWDSPSIQAGAKSFEESATGEVIFTISGRKVGGANPLDDVILKKTDKEGVVEVAGFKEGANTFLKFVLDEKSNTLRIAEGTTAAAAEQAEFKYFIPNAKKVLSADNRDRQMLHINSKNTGVDIVPEWGGTSALAANALTEAQVKDNLGGLKYSAGYINLGAGGESVADHKALLTHIYQTRWADVAMAGLQSGAARIRK